MSDDLKFPNLDGLPIGQDVRAEQRRVNMCRNCGELGHYTHECTEYGPLFHEEGKTFEDYAELNQEILEKLAAQIIEEHS